MGYKEPETTTRRTVRKLGLNAGLNGGGGGKLRNQAVGLVWCGPGVILLGKHAYGSEMVDAYLHHFQRDKGL